MSLKHKLAAVAASLAVVATCGSANAANTSITIVMPLEPPNLDPTGGAAAAIDEVVYANIYEGLTRYAPDGSVRPALAHSWDISEDGLVYTFRLREGVTFHDGTAFDANDVKFSLDRARAEDSTNAQKALFAGIADVEVVDPLTVRVTLSNPNGTFTTNMAWGDAVIVAEESIDSAATAPVGTGPFKFVEWRKGDSVEVARNADYWGEPVALEKAVFKFIAEPTAQLAALMAGDVDAIPNFAAPEAVGQFEANPSFNVILG